MKRSKTHAGLDDLTIVHFNDGVAFVRCTVEGKLCNVHYSLAQYLAGDDKPNYPMPAIPLAFKTVDFFTETNEPWLAGLAWLEDNNGVEVCYWDFKFDRAMDWQELTSTYKWGEYMHAQSIDWAAINKD